MGMSGHQPSGAQPHVLIAAAAMTAAADHHAVPVLFMRSIVRQPSLTRDDPCGAACASKAGEWRNHTVDVHHQAALCIREDTAYLPTRRLQDDFASMRLCEVMP